MRGAIAAGISSLRQRKVPQDHQPCDARHVASQTPKDIAREIAKGQVEHFFDEGLAEKGIVCNADCAEFSDIKRIEVSLCRKNRTGIHFAPPRCASERGANERHNSLIRRFIPKGCEITGYPNFLTLEKAKLIYLQLFLFCCLEHQVPYLKK